MGPLRSLLLLSVTLTALSACRDDGQPSPSAYALGPVEDLPLAPDAAALAYAPPSPVGRLTSAGDRYAWAERAYAVDRAFYRAPPDYDFYYDEVEPWAWETEDDWIMYAEPISAGYRYYYYEPGEDYPYFVRDPDYGYGYDDGGRLVVIYSVLGVPLSSDYLYQRAPIAGRYWARARDLRRVGREAEHRDIDEAIWRAREPVLVRTQTTWIEAAREQPDWRAYREQQGQRDVRRLEPERIRREERIARSERRPFGDRRETVVADTRDRLEPQRNERFNLAQVEDRRDRDEAARRRDEARREQFLPREDRRRGQEEALRRQQVQAQDRAAYAETRQQERSREEAQRRQQAQAEERRARAEVRQQEQRGRQEQMAREDQRRGREEAQRRQQAQAEERRGRAEAQQREQRGRQEQMAREERRRGREESQRRQQAQAEERRGRAEAQQREQRGRQEQMAREAQRRGEAERRAHAEAQQREQHGRQEAQRRQGEARQQQAQAEQVRRHGQEGQEKARNTAQAAQDASTNGKGGGDHGKGRGHKD